MWLALIWCTAFAILIHRLNKDYCILSLCRRIKRIDGGDLNDTHPVIPGKTIFGNNFDIAKMTPESVFQFICKCVKYSQGKSFIFHMLYSPVLNICRAEDAEHVLNSQTLLTKSILYQLLHTFLGTGLLTSASQKWHSRRKLLTPAFHFNILQSFIEIFKDESVKFLKALDENINRDLQLVDVIPRFTLNNICETAMGVKLDHMSDGDVYRKTINELEVRIVKRSVNILFYYEWIYKLFGDYIKYNENLKMVHSFRTEVINRKREEYQYNLAANCDERNEYGQKKRYAMLDTLLDAEAKGLIDHEGICEEVDTFMFEGYDTTSTCLIFSLFNLALYGDIQEKVYEEVKELADLKDLTVFDYNQLEYLECVIKETLRLYPSVPFIGREVMEDTILNGLLLPAATQINIYSYHLHRDPRHFPDPEKFDPKRFLPENSNARHPFVFIPFSAGPRNCIGQKFAMLEIKVLLASIVRNYKLLPVTRLEDLTFEYGLVLRTKQHVTIKIIKRT